MVRVASPFFWLFLDVFPQLQPSVYTFFLAVRCFVSARRLLFSVPGSLFLRWTFFVCTITSSVSRCFRVLLLQSVTRSDLRFYLSDGVARWDESLLFLFAPSCSTPVVRQTLVCSFMFLLLGFVSRFFSLPSSFCPDSFRPFYLWVSFPSSFLCFFFSFDLPVLFVAFCLYCPLPFFPVPP